MNRAILAMVIVLAFASVAAAQYEYVPAPVVAAPTTVVVPAPTPMVTYYAPVVPYYAPPAYVVSPGPVVYGGRYVLRTRYYPYATRTVIRGW